MNVPADPHFISTTLPGEACDENPLRDMRDDTMWAPMGDVYDGYFHIRRLTPETQAGDNTLPFSKLSAPASRVWWRFDQVRSIERRVLGARPRFAD